MSETKVCSKCGAQKPLTDFNRDSNQTSGHRSECRDCTKAMKKRRDTPDGVQRNTLHVRAWRKRHRDHFRELNAANKRAYRQKQREGKPGAATRLARKRAEKEAHP